MREVRLETLEKGARFYVCGKFGTLLSKGVNCVVRYDNSDPHPIAAGTMVQVVGMQILVYHQASFRGSPGKTPPLHRDAHVEPMWFYVGEGSPLWPDREAAQKAIGAKKKLEKGWEESWIRTCLNNDVKSVVEGVDEIVEALDAYVVKLACYCGNKEGCHGHALARIAMERKVWKLMEELGAD